MPTSVYFGYGTGNVVGPAGATDGGFAQYDGTTGELIKNHAATVAIGSEVSGLGTGVATFLGTPSSDNLVAALTGGASGTGTVISAITVSHGIITAITVT